MTAEIAIMNKEAVALAADSAVSRRMHRGRKIFTSANKLFALSKYCPVGIMVYDNATFMDVPWETIIKIYREKIGKGSFESLDIYADDFLSFLENANEIFPKSVQTMRFEEMVRSFLGFIYERCINDIKSVIDKRGKIEEKEIANIVNRKIDECSRMFSGAPTTPSITEEQCASIIKIYSGIIKNALEVVFEKLPISEENIDKLKTMSAELCWKFPKGLTTPFSSGIVIAGFGMKDIFPVLKSFTVEMISNNRLKYKFDKEKRIGAKLRSSIVPFAQKDVVETFMGGMDPSREKIEMGLLSELFDGYIEKVIGEVEGIEEGQKASLREKLVKIGKEKLQEHQQKRGVLRQSAYVQPIMDVISMLPRDELAVVAETFVSLTSFRRKVSMEYETVGGPVDVAVVSKGDGFVWIKRKHYFKPELNPHFFKNYWKEVNDGKKEEE